MAEIQLYDYQKPHCEKIVKSLKTRKSYIDCSTMGTGKTVMALYIAKTLKLDIYVICPVSMKEVWETTAKRYKIKIIDIISYQTLRGVKDKKMSHKYLTREDKKEIKNGKDNKTTKYKITEEMREIIEKGVLCIFDEIQNVKNKTAQAKACTTITSNIKGRSRIALLSATPIDKVEQISNVYKMMGILKENEELTTTGSFGRDFEYSGLQKIIDISKKINLKETIKIINEIGINTKTGNKIAYELLTKIMKEEYINIAIKPKRQEIESDIKDGEYNLTPTYMKKIKEGIDLIHLSVIMKDNKIDKIDDISGVMKGMHKIEQAKMKIITRITREKLKERRRKVIIYVNYKDSIETLREKLIEYEPLIMDGSTKQKERMNITKKFNYANSKYRVLIANMKVGGTGISLHDTDGRYPRTMYIVPTYSIMDLHQATGRVNRAGNKSRPEIRFIYSKMKESSLINALARKKEVLKEASTKEEQGITFPGEYEKEIEVSWEEQERINKEEERKAAKKISEWILEKLYKPTSGNPIMIRKIMIEQFTEDIKNKEKIEEIKREIEDTIKKNREKERKREFKRDLKITKRVLNK